MRDARKTLWFSFAAMIMLGACSDPDDTPPPNQPADMVADADATSDAPDEAPDELPDGPPPLVPGDPCTYQRDCAASEVCVAGACYEPPACERARSWGVCGARFEAIEPGISTRMACVDQRCRVNCRLDAECDSGQVCGDDGACLDYDEDVTRAPIDSDAPGPLQAGVGNVLLQTPIGLPAAGYGGGSGRRGRYTESMDPTAGQLHGLYVRALALDSGGRPLMLIRLPSVFPTMPMHEAVAQRLQTLTGENWRDSLVISGTHTHSGPGRFLHLPREALLDLGLLGVDAFHQQAFDWYVDSIVEAAQAALDDMKPARMGWTVAEAFDTDDRVASDRWSATPPFDDNRALLLRVDDLEGNPRAVLTSFGMHGTFNTSREYHSTDAPGAIESMLERKLAARYERHVPVMFFSSNGGSMSPRGDRTGHRESHKFDHIGQLFADQVWDALEGITTKAQVSLGGVTMRFPMTSDLLGYEAGEFISTLAPFDDLRYGGLQCSVAKAEDNDYATHAPLGTVRCFGVHQVLFNIAPSLFLRSQISALNLDGMTIVTMPGEVTMELGWEVLRAMRDAYGIDPLASFVFGYAQDHKFYLTPRNLRGDSPPFPGQSTPMPIDDYPDYAFSYFQGGYEAGFSPWGPRGGDYLRERAVEAVGMLLGEPIQPAVPSALPMVYSRRDSPEFAIDDTDPARLGQIVQDMPAQLERLTQHNFSWVGGDPGAERPQAPHVTLERQTQGGQWEPVLGPSARPYDNRDPLMVTRTWQAESGDHLWAVYWEELKHFPTGTYRFQVSGHSSQAGVRTPYSLTSGAFEVRPSSAIAITLSDDARGVRGQLGYPAAPALRVVGGDGDWGRVEGTYRMRHMAVPTNVSDPVEVGEDLVDLTQFSVIVRDEAMAEVARYDGALLSTAPETVDGRADVPVTRFTLPTTGLTAGQRYEAVVSVTDRYGNTGSATHTFTAPQ